MQSLLIIICGHQEQENFDTHVVLNMDNVDDNDKKPSADNSPTDNSNQKERGSDFDEDHGNKNWVRPRLT